MRHPNPHRDLAAIPLFHHCGRAELRRLAKLTTVVTAQRGARLAVEGHFSHQLVVIESGAAEVTVGGQQVATLGPGDFFGEIGLLDGEPMTATVVAATPMRVRVIGQADFASFTERSPAACRGMLRAMAARLRADMAMHGQSADGEPSSRPTPRTAASR